MRFQHPAVALSSVSTKRVPALGQTWEPAPTGPWTGATGPELLDPASSKYQTVTFAEQATGIASSAGAQIVQAAAGGQDIGQAAAMTGVVTAGQIASGMATAAWAIPVIGAAVAGVTLWLSSIFRRNAQKEAATEIVNQIEPKLKENLNGYFSGPRTLASQAQALHNFDAAWEAMKQALMNSQLGSAGQRGISDRQQGACTWKASCSRVIDGICVDYKLDPNGECWNWFVGYRDPIAKDPLPAMRAQQQQSSSVVGAATGGSSFLLLGGIGLLIAAAFFGGAGNEQ